VFTVTVTYSGQPERNAGDYPTRDAAARAAARLATNTGPDGQRPVGVGIHDAHREPPANVPHQTQPRRSNEVGTSPARESRETA
jgi:hypothetical protein